MAKAKSLKTRAKSGFRKSAPLGMGDVASADTATKAATPGTAKTLGTIAPVMSLPPPVGRPTSSGRKGPVSTAPGARRYESAKSAAQTE